MGVKPLQAYTSETIGLICRILILTTYGHSAKSAWKMLVSQESLAWPSTVPICHARC
jgi:hypothetical protein